MEKRVTKTYDQEFKSQAVKLAQEIGAKQAAEELAVPQGTVYEWLKAFKEGRLVAEGAVHTAANAQALNDELVALRKQNKALEKENRRLQELNEFLEEASTFFAASRQKCAKKKD